MSVALEPWRTPGYSRFERLSQWPLLALSLALVPILLIPDVAHPSHHETSLLDKLDWSIWIVFVLDYLTRLYLAGGHRRTFVRHNLFDLALVLVPMLRPLRLARVARTLRAGRLGALLGSTSHRQQTSVRNRALVSVSAGILCIAFGAAGAFAWLLVWPSGRHATRAWPRTSLGMHWCRA